VRFFHTTPRYNRSSIEGLGILARYSQGKRKAIWLHTEEKTAWAFLHTVRRHGCDVHDVITFEVEVDFDLLKYSGSGGLYYLEGDVEPEFIRGVRGFRVVSESPIKGKAHARR
jgi:hypothetical protein